MINNQIKSNIVTISLQGKPIGSFSLNNDKIIFSSDLKDEVILNIIKDARKDGIQYLEYVYSNNKCVSILKKSFPADDSFINELIKLIKKNDYEIYEEVVELNQEISSLLSFLPEETTIKKDILEDLSNMNYLEKTYIKYQLEKKIDELSKVLN